MYEPCLPLTVRQRGAAFFVKPISVTLLKVNDDREIPVEIPLSILCVVAPK